jgi:hypothetical protein
MMHPEAAMALHAAHDANHAELLLFLHAAGIGSHMRTVTQRK